MDNRRRQHLSDELLPVSDYRAEQGSTPGVGLGNRAQRRFKGSPKSGKSQSSAYSSFLETLPIEQRGDFERFCQRKVERRFFREFLGESFSMSAGYLDAIAVGFRTRLLAGDKFRGVEAGDDTGSDLWRIPNPYHF